jgi:hypothetical protein
MKWIKYQWLRLFSKGRAQFAGGEDYAYRAHLCASCRKDDPRTRMAKKSDKTTELQVQEIKCALCSERKPWWWFSRLPVTRLEKVEVVNFHRGKAW